MPAGSSPKSIMIVSSSSRGSSIVLTIRPTVVCAVETAQQRLEQRRLARSDLAGDDDEAGLALEAVAQVVERLLVDAARIEVFGIRAERERTFAELVEPFVHAQMPPTSARARHAPSLPCASAVIAAASRSGWCRILPGRMLRHQRHADGAHAEADPARSARSVPVTIGSAPRAAYTAASGSGTGVVL